MKKKKDELFGIEYDGKTTFTIRVLNITDITRKFLEKKIDGFTGKYNVIIYSLTPYKKFTFTFSDTFEIIEYLQKNCEEYLKIWK